MPGKTEAKYPRYRIAALLCLAICAQSVILLCAGCLTPSVSDGTGEDNSAIIREVTVHEALFILEKLQEDPGFTVIDVRGRQEWSNGTLPGAIPLELASLNFTGEFDSLDKEDTYLIFGSDEKDAATIHTVVEYFGFVEAYIITDGFGAWQGAGYTVMYPAEEEINSSAVQPEVTGSIFESIMIA